MHDGQHNNLLLSNDKEQGIREAMNECAMNRFVDLRKLERISFDSFQALFHAQQ